MRKLLVVGLPVLAAAALMVSVGVGPTDGAVKKGETRPLRTKTLMGKIVGANCGALGKGLKAEEIDWAALAANAELLNECGHILMADKRCPDGTWAGAAKTLQGCSAVLVEKIAAEDAEGARGAFAAMTKSCGACHKAHKPKKK